MPWCRWRRRWSVTRSTWTTASWRAPKSHLRMVRIIWNPCRLPPISLGSIAPPWLSSVARFFFKYFNKNLFLKFITLSCYDLFIGLCQAVRQHPGWPRHARHLRRFAQHRQSGAAHGGRKTQNIARSPKSNLFITNYYLFTI